MSDHPNAPGQPDPADDAEGERPAPPPPSDMDAEAAVLSSVLLSGGPALDTLGQTFDARFFFSESHRRIYEACADLHDNVQPVDVVQVATWLRDRDRLAQVGGMAYLTEVLNAAPAVTNIAGYARTVRDLWRMRKVIERAADLVTVGKARTQEPRAFVMGAAESLSELAQDMNDRPRAVHIGVPLKTVYDEVVKSYERGSPSGIPTGLHEYDDLTSGLHEGELTIFAGRPGMGKTAALLSVSLHIVKTIPPMFRDDGTAPMRPQAVYFYSAEMPAEQIARRALASEASVSLTHLRTGRIAEQEWSPLSTAAGRLSSLHMYVDDESALHIRELAARVRNKRRELDARGVDLRVVAVDYLQLCRGDGYNVRTREAEVSAISRGLAVLAKEGYAVLAGAQLNRDVEGRSNKRPGLADLRESGAIEQDAQNIAFLYRPEVYGAVPEADQGLCEVILAKQRDGRTGTARTRYRGIFTRFENMDL